MDYSGLEKQLSCQVHTLETIGASPIPAINCKLCNKVLTKIQRKFKGKFCSRNCSATFNNKGLNRWGTEYKCQTCGLRLEKKRKFCVLHRKLGNAPTNFNDLKRDHTRKKWLLKERGHKCEICGLDSWRGNKIPLTLDHIDGNSDNNVKENFRLICWNCHALTPTFGVKNIGRFPESDRNRRIRESHARKTM